MNNFRKILHPDELYMEIKCDYEMSFTIKLNFARVVLSPCEVCVYVFAAPVYVVLQTTLEHTFRSH